jgi:hypothetical protein
MKKINWLDRVRNRVFQTVKKERKFLLTVKRSKANWIGLTPLQTLQGSHAKYTETRQPVNHNCWKPEAASRRRITNISLYTVLVQYASQIA